MQLSHYPHLSIVFSEFAPFLAQIFYSTFIIFFKNLPLFMDYFFKFHNFCTYIPSSTFIDFTTFAPPSRLFSPHWLLER